jgi:hypothetical protein
MSARGYTAVMYRNGQRIDYIHPSSLAAVMSINDIYFCSLTTSRTQSLDYYEIDNDVLIHRMPANPKIPPFQFFTGKILDRDEWENDSGEYTQLGIYGLNELLTRRDVDYQAGGSSQTLKTGNADDVMKELVNENMGSGAVAARQYPSANWSEATDVSAAPSDTFEFPHQNVFDVLQYIAESSAQDGTGLYFDVVWKNKDAFEFRTFIDQLGADTTTGIGGTKFADFRGNIANPRLSEKFSEEYNLVNAWGVGEPGDQDKAQEEDTERSGRSPWARREYSIQTSIDDSTALASYAKAELRSGRPSLIFKCDLLDNHPTAVYGKDWKFGDKVEVGFNGRTYTGLVRSLNARWSADKGETSFSGKFMYVASLTAGGTGIP